MDIKELTQVMHCFVRDMGWYCSDSPHPQTLRNLSISLSLEASEVLEHFQWGESHNDSQALSEELADVALYLLQIASLSNIDLEKAILKKLEMNYQRNWEGEEKENSCHKTDRDKKGMVEKTFVTVFGGSQPKPGEDAYQEAVDLGQLLAEAGYGVQTGGYMGTMEAVSRGAAEVGGDVIGITCDQIERWRPIGPNSWVMEEERYPTLKQRLYALIERCDAAIALPGGIGTLQEIVVMWAQMQIRASDARPLILVGEGWEKIMNAFYLYLGEYVAPEDRAFLHFSPDVKAAVNLLTSLISSI